MWTNINKCQIRVGARVPAARMKGEHVLWIVAVKACPSNKALFIGTAGSINPVNMWTIKIASIENGVREHWEIRRLQSRKWRFVDIDNSITINVLAQPLSLRCSWILINKGSILAGHGRTWQGHASYLKKTQLVQSLVLLAYLHKCSEFPEEE